MEQLIVNPPLPAADLLAPATEAQTDTSPIQPAEIHPTAPQPTETSEPAQEVTIVAGRIRGLGDKALSELTRHPWFISDQGPTGNYSKGRSGL